LPVLALDAAFPFDREAQLRQQHSQQGKLRIGLVGFGTFGQFLAQRMVKAGHEVIATSRSPYHEVAEAMGVRYYTDANDFCEEHPEVVMLATSILSLQQVLAALPVQRLKRNTLFVDVLSVKEFPKRLLLRTLPPEVDILCTHPMFGPDSGGCCARTGSRSGWQGGWQLGSQGHAGHGGAYAAAGGKGSPHPGGGCPRLDAHSAVPRFCRQGQLGGAEPAVRAGAHQPRGGTPAPLRHLPAGKPFERGPAGARPALLLCLPCRGLRPCHHLLLWPAVAANPPAPPRLLPPVL
jgi:hypothetical protein